VLVEASESKAAAAPRIRGSAGGPGTGRATLAAGLAIASCWWWRGCFTWKAYVAVGVVAFFGVATAGVLGRIFKNPARLYSFRFGIAWYVADFGRWFRT
jgi:hypothetical protein